MTDTEKEILRIHLGSVESSLENALFHLQTINNLLRNCNTSADHIKLAEAKVLEAGFWAAKPCSQ